MKRVMLVASLLLAAAVGTLFGIVLERHGAFSRFVDWAGLYHLVATLRPREVSGRTEVPLSSLPRERTMVALVFGQSNAANSAETLATEVENVYEYYQGRLYRARDPLLGADGDRGSVWMRLARMAIDSGTYDRVVLVAFAFGSTEIRRWAPGGSLHAPLLDRIAQARASGLEFTHLLWHQGEADAMAHTRPQQYEASLRALIAALRAHGVHAPLYVATATRCGRTRPVEAIRDAQRAVLDAANGVLAGPDTDALGFAERYDGCHFSTEGLDHAGQLWLRAILAQPNASTPR